MNQGCSSVEKLQYFNPYVYDTCDLGFSNPIQLDDHVFANSSVEVTVSKCYHCSKIFADEKSLKIHIQAKHKLQNCRCPFCSISYENFRRYLRMLDSRYICPYCNKYFYRWKDLNVHMSVYEKPMRCKICGKKFRTSWLMRQHLIDEHPEEECDWLLKHCFRNLKNQGAAKVAELNSLMDNQLIAIFAEHEILFLTS